jgi:hypothetical protein
MATRTRREAVSFDHSFVMKGIGRVSPPGNYVVVTDEELIEGDVICGLPSRIDCHDGSGSQSTFLGRDADYGPP